MGTIYLFTLKNSPPCEFFIFHTIYSSMNIVVSIVGDEIWNSAGNTTLKKQLITINHKVAMLIPNLAKWHLIKRVLKTADNMG